VVFNILDSQFDSLLSTTRDSIQVDPNITQLSNLYAMLKIKDNKITNRLLEGSDGYSIEELANKHNKLLNKIFNNSNLTGRKIFGNIHYNTQITSATKDAITEAITIAKQHNITATGFDTCIAELRKKYKLNDDDITIIKSEGKIEGKGNTVKNNIDITYLNSNTNEILDKSSCKTDKSTIQIPVVMTDSEKRIYEEFKKQGIDLYDSSQQAFRSKCFSFSDPNDEVDTTLDYRITNYLVNRTECFDNGCVYVNMTTDGFINCDCGGSVIDNTASDTFPDSSSNLLACAGYVQLRGANLGLIVAIVLLAGQVGLTILFVYLRKNKKLYLDKIIRQDCVIFEPNKVTLDKYFFRDSPFQMNKSSEEQKNKVTEDDGDVNTYRNLKTDNVERRATCDPLTLKQNLDKMESVEHHRVDGEFDDNKKVVEVHIYNNFVDRKNMTQEITIDNKGVYENELKASDGKPTINHEITLMDYESLPFHEMLHYDKRSFTRYLLDNLVRQTIVCSIFLKHSYLDPVYIRIAKLIFSISMIFGLNALLGDLYIEKQNISTGV
jgi:hypothetical protein